MEASFIKTYTYQELTGLCSIANAVREAGGEYPEGDLTLEALLQKTETLIADCPQETIETPVLLSYSFLDEVFFQDPYQQRAVDYEQLWYGEKRIHDRPPPEFEQRGDYALEIPAGDVEREMLTLQEAEETFMDVQYAALTGVQTDISSEERRKFQWIILFERWFFNLLESSYALTRNVDYGCP